jgi:hypothetical protein
VTFALTTFVVSLLIMLGAYWALVLRPEEAGRTATIGRLRERARATVAGVVLTETQLSSIPLLDRLLRHRQELISSNLA